MNKLRIGDKIKWNVSIGGDFIYTILDIDTSREPLRIIGIEIRSEVLMQWESDGELHQEWGHSYHDLNMNLNNGGITIIGRDIEPIKEIKKFTL
jgi:hypothetical protein